MSTTSVVATGVANVHRDPDANSEMVTQALMNMPAIMGARSGAWVHVTLPDYEGWMQSDDLADPVVKGFCKVSECCGTPLDLMAVVVVTNAPLYTSSSGEETCGTIYLSTTLPLLDITHEKRLQVALPDDQSAWLARSAANIRRQAHVYPRVPIDAIIRYAHSFIDVPYLWGGTSWQGIDCSGFVQLCYRMGGYRLPRDADQQYDALVDAVKREQMRAGDLIFFGRKAITHVALALNDKEYIHAEGQRYNRVTINSFDQTDPHYDQRLDEIVWGIRRVIS
ncbi:MAG TPA: C40 family peptidase [Ktedonosporobacter sp.]|nr:C40 family peptidase [Ktedonosporobacter sp.]